MNHEQITKEYVARKQKYFEAREAYKKHERTLSKTQDSVSVKWAIELAILSEEEGYAKALFTD